MRLMAHPPRIPVWLPLEKEVAYFVTICVQGRQPVLANQETLIALQNAVHDIKRWRLIAAMVMPDHIHLLAAPLDRDAPVGEFTTLLKRAMRRKLAAKWNWQAGCFDHLLRSDESAQQKWEYMRENPVRAGLVPRPQDWPYSIGFTHSNPPSAAAWPTNRTMTNPPCRAGGPPAAVLFESRAIALFRPGRPARRGPAVRVHLPAEEPAAWAAEPELLFQYETAR